MTEKEEREKAFYELQDRYAQTLDAMRRLNQAERSTQMGKQRLELVLSELGSMPENIPVYRQIGRAYFLEPKSKILSVGAQTIAAAGSNLEMLEKNKGAVELKLKELQGELQELAK